MNPLNIPHRDYYEELTSGDPQALLRWVEAYDPVMTTTALEELVAGVFAHGQPPFLTDDLSGRLVLRYLERGNFQKAIAAWGKIESPVYRSELEGRIVNQLEMGSLGRYFDALPKLEWERLKVRVAMFPEIEKLQFAMMLLLLGLAVLSFAFSNLSRTF